MPGCHQQPAAQAAAATTRHRSVRQGAAAASRQVCTSTLPGRCSPLATCAIKRTFWLEHLLSRKHEQYLAASASNRARVVLLHLSCCLRSSCWPGGPSLGTTSVIHCVPWASCCVCAHVATDCHSARCRVQLGDSLEEFLIEATPDANLRQLMMSMSEAIRTIAFKVRSSVGIPQVPVSCEHTVMLSLLVELSLSRFAALAWALGAASAAARHPRRAGACASSRPRPQRFQNPAISAGLRQQRSHIKHAASPRTHTHALTGLRGKCAGTHRELRRHRVRQQLRR